MGTALPAAPLVTARLVPDPGLLTAQLHCLKLKKNVL